MKVSRYIPLFVCAASCVCALQTALRGQRMIKTALARQADLDAVATNFFAYARRVDVLESDVASLALGTSSRSSSIAEPASVRGKSTEVQSIPYRFFSAGNSRGIYSDTSLCYVGDYTRYGLLTDCGRDFAIFDGSRVVGLGVSNDR